MNSNEQQKLEDFIHAQLRKLPEHEAPASLVANVLAAVAEQKELPWYKQSWSEWPRLSQSVFLGFLIAFAGVIVQALAPLTESISMGTLAKRASVLTWLWEVCGSLFGALLLALGDLSWEWLAGLAAVAFSMYLACVGGGMALYRITAVDNRSAL